MVSCRWGGTPLDDSMRHDHREVSDYLRSQGGTVGKKVGSQPQLSEQLCAAAAMGNVGEVRRLASSGADVNQGDYDKRTAMCVPPPTQRELLPSRCVAS